MSPASVPGSFRDPSGFVFVRDGVLYRQVNSVHRPHYDLLMASGLYGSLVAEGLLVPHEEVAIDLAAAPGAHRVLRPERIPFVSHPYEWCFDQLKDAALATLRIQEIALDHGMSLRDASAYNLQFHRGRPVLVDTLSFERLAERPWPAYRQFCQHFLAPLALMSYRDGRLGGLARIHLDGVPLDLATGLLPLRARLRPSLLLHLFLHARNQRRHERAGASGPAPERRMTLRALRGVVESLAGAVRRLEWNPARSAWAGYYAERESYAPDAFESKRRIVAELLEEARPGTVWDIGGNTGAFARLATERGMRTVCFDADPAAVQECYRTARAENDELLLPLLMDLTNPSPAIGWEHTERPSLLDRGPADLAMALALIHHLAIGNNVPLPRVASFLSRIGDWAIVEFVPKTDPKVRELLATREDVFPDYSPEGFEAAFDERFLLKRREPIPASERVVYLMRSR